MDIAELKAIAARGEDSQHQFKRAVTSAEQLAAEMVAFANSGGGRLLVGVGDDGSLPGLSADEVARLNQLISNAASQQVEPPLAVQTRNLPGDEGSIVVVTVPDGPSKPYFDARQQLWVKVGADKRRVTAREELRRLFQQGGLVQADKMPVGEAGIDALDMPSFVAYYERRFDEPCAEQPLAETLRSLGLAQGDQLTTTGVLLFAKRPQLLLLNAVVKAVSFHGVDVASPDYIESKDITGRLEDLYQACINFLERNLRHTQQGQGVNSIGKLEIPRRALEEVLVNALVHRDYFSTAVVRLFVFDDRVEIISPGHLPNSLTVENVRSGVSTPRNPVLLSHAAHLLPYRGIGSGIRRALAAWPHMDLQDDRQGNQFVVTLWRTGSSRVE